jgi:oxygen-independent coproporphyrinogen-3 oxidase
MGIPVFKMETRIMEINQEIIQRYNTAGPRYTSYPPANVFREDLTGEDYLCEVDRSNQEGPEGISLYVHVPFCPRLCFFCGCNSQKANNKDIIDRYFKALVKEIDRISDHIDGNRSVNQVHWGGGTPNSVDWNLIEMVMDRFRKRFHIMEDAEIAMECSPAYLDLEDLDRISELGFNRLSLGIQDFNEEILKTINRDPSRLPVEKLVNYIRLKGFSGVNLDFIYGLPGQTHGGYLETLKKAVDIRPERLVTFSYAHVPWVKKNQKILEKHRIPGPEQKFEMLLKGYDYITGQGYDAIGIDHFALPGDEMVKAYRSNALHRNFQGYCTLKHTGQVYAFGASAISQMHGSYFQNKKDAKAYIDSVEKGKLPVSKGYILNKDEKVIRRIINQLMCNGLVHFSREAQTLNMSTGELKELLAYSPGKFNRMKNDGLLMADEEMMKVTPLGMLLVRVIAKELDPNYARYQKEFSKTI